MGHKIEGDMQWVKHMYLERSLVLCKRACFYITTSCIYYLFPPLNGTDFPMEHYFCE